MKKTFILLAAALCTLCACQKKEIELLDQPIIQSVGDKVSMTFTAIIADDLSDVDTKASVARDGSFSWNVGDALVFKKSDGTSAPASVTAVDGLVATITVTTEDSRDSFVSAIYPADAAVENEAYKINFNARGPIVVSAVNGGTLTFYHIGSLINLKFTSIPTGTASLVFTPYVAFHYDGTFVFSGREPVLQTTDNEEKYTSKIVVSASTADEDKDITVCVPSVSLTGGFSAALNNAAAGNGRNLFKKSTSTNHDLATKRPVLLNMKKVDYVAPQFYITTTTSSSPSVTVTDAHFVRTGANTYELGFNTAPNTSYSVYDSYNTTALKTGTINSSASDSDVKLLGSQWGWTYKSSDGLVTKVENGVNSVKGVKLTSTPTYFKFQSDASSNNQLGWYDNDYVISDGTTATDISWGSYSKSFRFANTENGTYDFYVSPGSSSGKANILVISSSSSSLRPDYRTTLVSYNSSSNSATTTDKDYHKDAFSAYSSISDLNLYANFEGSDTWNDYTFTYNGNHAWYTSIDLTGKDGAAEYLFKFRKGSSDWTVSWGNPNNNNYPYSGSQTFGTCNQGGAYNLHVYLDNAVYDVYVNDMTWESNKLRFDFVKR